MLYDEFPLFDELTYLCKIYEIDARKSEKDVFIYKHKLSIVFLLGYASFGVTPYHSRQQYTIT